jgi:hypothetical protein
MSKRISQAEYDAFFNESTNAQDSESPATDVKKGEEGKVKKGEALKYALEIRSFEIDLYWKRATYFWAFIGATFAGYGAVQASSIPAKIDLSVALSCLGLVFSFGWFCVNKGSKQWQENWENHVDLLEDEIVGPLYKIVLTRPKPQTLKQRAKRCVAGPGPFSVSKINQIISLFVTVLWLFLLWLSLPSFSKDASINWEYVVIIIVTFIFCGCFLFWGKTESDEGNVKPRPYVAFKREAEIEPKI